MEGKVKQKDGGFSRRGVLSNSETSTKKGPLFWAASGKGGKRVKDTRPIVAKKHRRLILSDSESDEDLGSGFSHIRGVDRNSFDRRVPVSSTNGDHNNGSFGARGLCAEERKVEHIDEEGRKGDVSHNYVENSVVEGKLRGAYDDVCAEIDDDRDLGGGIIAPCKENAVDNKSWAKDAAIGNGLAGGKGTPLYPLVSLDRNAADGEKSGNPLLNKEQTEQGNEWSGLDSKHKDKKALPSKDNELNSRSNQLMLQLNGSRQAATVLAEEKMKISDEVVRGKADEEDIDLDKHVVSNGHEMFKGSMKNNGLDGSGDHIAHLYETLASRKTRLCSSSMGVDVTSTTPKDALCGWGMDSYAYPADQANTKEEGSCWQSRLEGEDDIGSLESKQVRSKENKDAVTGVPDLRDRKPSLVDEDKVSGEPHKLGKGERAQLVREKVKAMLLGAGWKVEQRPRRGQVRGDSVYVSPSGVTYWSIPNAYYALQKELTSAVKEGDLSTITKSDDEKPPGKSLESLHGTEATTSGSPRRLDSHPVESLFPSFSEKDLSILERKRKRAMSSSKKEGNIKKSRKNAEGIQSTNNVTAHKGQKVVKGSRVMHIVKRKHLKERKVVSANGTKSCNIGRNVASALQSKEVAGKCSNWHKMKAEVDCESCILDKKNSSSASASEVLQGRKKKGKRKCTLIVRSSIKGKYPSSNNDVTPCVRKITILSWLIDLGSVQLHGKAKYWNKRRTRMLMEGCIKRDGILCNCCGKTLSVTEFEIHAGSKMCQPYQNIFVDSGLSLLECQLQAWNAQEESQRCGMYLVETDENDQNDDTCGICGDGGNLICCDSCPSTFHPSCLGLQTLPPGIWHCPHCSCRFCGGYGDASNDSKTVKLMETCSQCEAKYHRGCAKEKDISTVGSNGQFSSFCGRDCRKIFESLHDLLGSKHDLDDGFSWTLVQRDGLSQSKLAEQAECNSKIAIALNVMDECFMPIVDQRTKANLIHNIVYNRGSNFNRVNYAGFYSLLLQRGDEVISVASIRIHGTRLAEMPLVGTRHLYRRQGMCRRLITVVESILSSLNVEMLVIPAISELLQTWTTVFGFKPLQDLHKEEIRRMNLMVFPGTDLLQKALLSCDAAAVKSERKLDLVQQIEEPPVEVAVAISSKVTESGSLWIQGDDAIEPNVDAPVEGSALFGQVHVSGDVERKLDDVQHAGEPPALVTVTISTMDDVSDSLCVQGEDAIKPNIGAFVEGSTASVSELITEDIRVADKSYFVASDGLVSNCTSEEVGLKQTNPHTRGISSVKMDFCVRTAVVIPGSSLIKGDNVASKPSSNHCRSDLAYFASEVVNESSEADRAHSILTNDDPRL